MNIFIAERQVNEDASPNSSSVNEGSWNLFHMFLVPEFKKKEGAIFYYFYFFTHLNNS